MSVYLDASLLVALFLPDATSERAINFIANFKLRPVTTDFAIAEFASAVGRRVRMDRVQTQDAHAMFHEFDAWIAASVFRVSIAPADVAVSNDFLRRLDLNLRTPDALHIAAAKRLNLTLATFDTRMADCARQLGVETAEV